MKEWTALLCGLLFAIPVFAGHPGSLDLNPHQATPGLKLELIEINSGRDHSPKKYRLLAADYPRNAVFSVYAKDFSDKFTEVATGFQVDGSGTLVSNTSGRPQRLQDLEFTPGLYPRGAAWNIAIASTDRSIAAFARLIPIPLKAQAEGCSLSLELLNLRGDRFLVSGVGFSPGEDVMTQAKFDGRIEQKQMRILDDGALPRHVMSHAALGIDRRASYSIKSRICKVVINYEWGNAALIRR